ncbi:hypothetical protein [Nocardioides pyridinolyticus]
MTENALRWIVSPLSEPLELEHPVKASTPAAAAAATLIAVTMFNPFPNPPEQVFLMNADQTT